MLLTTLLLRTNLSPSASPINEMYRSMNQSATMSIDMKVAKPIHPNIPETKSGICSARTAVLTSRYVRMAMIVIIAIRRRRSLEDEQFRTL